MEKSNQFKLFMIALPVDLAVLDLYTVTFINYLLSFIIHVALIYSYKYKGCHQGKIALTPEQGWLKILIL